MKMIYILFLLALLSSSSHASSVVDFCIGDLKFPKTPSGYPCKSPKTVTGDDFVFPKFVVGNRIKPFNVGFINVFDSNFPGLNGLGIAATRVEMGTGGVVPVHTHPGGTELLMMVEGQMTVGFISSDDNTPYVKTLKPGDIMVIPQGLLHFQINSGKGNTTSFAAYTSANPRLDLIDFSFFGNKLPSEIVAKTTFIDFVEVKRLKKFFGGSG